MLNPFSTEYSKSNLPAQKQFTLSALPFVKQIAEVDNEINMKKDYFYEGDAVAISMNDKNYNLQYKSRDPKHDDFVLLARKLTGYAATENDSFGFWYRGEKYSFCPQSDYYVEHIQGKNYCISKEDIESAEALWPETLQNVINYIEPKVAITDDGIKIPTGLYWVYISPVNIGKILYYNLANANPNIDFVAIANAMPEKS